MQYNDTLLIQKIAYDKCSKCCPFVFTYAVHLETVAFVNRADGSLVVIKFFEGIGD